MGSLALRETFKSFFTSWRGPLPKGMVPEQKLRKFYDRAKARGRDFPCMGHLGPLGFAWTIPYKISAALLPHCFLLCFQSWKLQEKK